MRQTLLIYAPTSIGMEADDEGERGNAFVASESKREGSTQHYSFE